MAIQPYYPPWINTIGFTEDQLKMAGDTMNSFAKGAAQAAQRAALEEQTKRLDMELENMKSLAAYRTGELDVRRQEAKARNSYWEDSLDARSRTADRLEQEYQDKKESKDQLGRIVTGANKIDLNSPSADSQYADLQEQNPSGAASAQGVSHANAFHNRLNSNARVRRQAWDSRRRAWYQDTKKNVFNDYQGDWSILLGTEPGTPGSVWHQQYGQYEQTVDPKTGLAKGIPGSETGNYFALIHRDPQDPAKNVFLTKPKELIDRKYQEYKALQDDYHNLPQQHTYPGYGVYPQNIPSQPNAGPSGRVRMIDPNGKPVTVPASQVPAAVRQGYTPNDGSFRGTGYAPGVGGGGGETSEPGGDTGEGPPPAEDTGSDAADY